MLPRTKDPSQEVLDQVRVNVAFENMVFSVLAGAAVGGGLTLLVKLTALFFGGFSFSELLAAVLSAMLAAFLIFLVGFFASVAIGAPLFLMLERRKQRAPWPYFIIALAISVVVLVTASRGLPGPEHLQVETLTAIFIPAIVIALIFSRQMRPHWRAAERAEREAEGPVLFRIQ